MALLDGPSQQSGRVSVRVLAAGRSRACGQPTPPHTAVMFCQPCPPPTSSAAPGPSSWGFPERKLLLVGTACHRATRLGCRHPSPPRQHQPGRSRPRGERPPTGAVANPRCPSRGTSSNSCGSVRRVNLPAIRHTARSTSPCHALTVMPHQYGQILLPWRCIEDQKGLTNFWRSGL
jgi:hypothetical protein